nr:MAG TPA: hypothetical protein [Caudoviricetes sp.]
MGKHEPCILLILSQSAKNRHCTNCTPGQR